jgi:hypothetical protein
VEQLAAPIGAGQSADIAHAFSLDVTYDPAATDSLKRITLPLRISIESSTGTHTQEISPVIFLPAPVLVGAHLQDLAATDPLPPDSIANGRDMGMTLELYNRGGGAASRLRAHIRPVNPSAVTMREDSVVTFPDILEDGLGTSGRCTFHVLQVSNLRFNVTLEDSGSAHTCWQRTLRVDTRPAPPDSLQGFGTGSSIRLTWLDKTNSSIWGYRVYRSEDTAGPFEPLPGGGLVPSVRTLTDEGLPGLHRYFYRVTALDNSARESRPGSVLDASTAPAMTPGWPNFIVQSRDASPTIEHPRMGLVTNAVVIASDALYVFKGDGQDYVDGDENASTRGPFMNVREAQTFWGKPVVCDVDGDGEKEIIAVLGGEGSHTPPLLGSLICFDHNGGIKWEKGLGKAQHLVSSPAVGHIDARDHSKLQIVFLVDGYVVAFNGDGTPFGSDPNGRIYTIQGGPGWPVQGLDYQAGSVALADLDPEHSDAVDGDPTDEIIFTTRPWDNFPQYAKLYVLRGRNSAGQYAIAFSGAFPYEYDLGPNAIAKQGSNSSPAVGDVTGDGNPDIVVSTGGMGGATSNIWLFSPTSRWPPSPTRSTPPRPWET